ncbi:MAG: AI-2E family transporter [Patescibacteria group bacterium]
MFETSSPVKVSLTTDTMVRFLLILVGFFLLYFFFDLILIILTSVVIASAVEPAARSLVYYRIPRVVAVLAVYLASFLVIISFVYIFLPPIFEEASGIISTVPEQLAEINLFDTRFNPLRSLGGYLGADIDWSAILVDFKNQLSTFSGGTVATASAVFGGIFSLIMILVLSFYLAVQEKGVENFLRIILPLRYEQYVIGLWRRSQEKIGQWMKGQLLLGIIVGVLVYLGLTILGVKHALVLAILAALFELIPIFGPVLAAVPAAMLGFLDSVTLGFMVIGLYIIIQQFENHLFYPLVVRKIVGVPPIIVIISLIVGYQLAGFLGIILAVPVATVIMELASDIEQKKILFRQKPQSKTNIQ